MLLISSLYNNNFLWFLTFRDYMCPAMCNEELSEPRRAGRCRRWPRWSRWKTLEWPWNQEQVASLQHDCNAKNLLLLSTLHSATLSPRSWWYLPQGAPSRFCARRSFGAHQVRFDGTLGLPSLFSCRPLFSTVVYRTGASLLVVCQACKVQNQHYF